MRSLAKLLMLALLASPLASRADWLDLSDGTWDLTLTCVYTSVACPGSFHASVTIGGGGATAMSTVFDNLTFSGDPTDGIASVPGLSAQVSSLVIAPYAFFALDNDLDVVNPFGLTDHYWGYCRNFDATSCTPAAQGNWVASLVSPVPEPSALALMAVGLSGMAALRRRRRSQTA